MWLHSHSHDHDTRRQLRYWRFSQRTPGLTIAAGLALALALALAGCGVTTVTSTSGGAAAGGATPAATGGVAKATGAANAPATPKPPSGGMAVRSCPGPFGSASAAGTPNVIVTLHAQNGTASAHVGDLVQVQLPATLHWSLDEVPASMVVVPPSGIQDDELGMCIWNFRAVASGTSQITFTGTAVCERAMPCAQLALAADFTVNVS